MAILDPETGQFSDAAFGLDTTAALQDQGSVWDSVGAVMSKGLPLTALSIVNSFANTGMQYANIISGGLTGVINTQLGLSDNYTVGAELDSIGADDYKDYYERHQQGVEAAGLAIGGLIPGLTAVKALKIAQMGKFGPAMQRATSLFSGPRDAIIRDALGEINAGNSALFGGLQAQKYKAIALGFGDQALQMLAFETAVAGTMKQSPLLQEQDMGDMLTNMLYGVVLGGGIGGALEGIGTRAIFNKAIFNADTATKASELSTRFGYGTGATSGGTSIAGDRVVALMDSIDRIPDDLANSLATKKAISTRDNGVLDSKLILGELSGAGNEDLAGATFDTVMRMKSSGASKDEMYNYLAGLSSIKRIDEPLNIPVGDTFYVNRAVGGKAPTSFEEMITKAPLADAELSTKYALKPFASTPRIANATDTFVDTAGVTQPRYASLAEAWQDEADMFIDKNLRIHVNPNAPNIAGRVPREGENRVLTAKEEIVFRKTGALPESSKPLTGAPIVLNTVSGDITSSAVPVVGDYGAPKLFDRGLSFGGKTSLQDVSKGLSEDTSTLDANARYVWADQRGIQRGDTILADDIPMLEKLHREATASGNFEMYMENAAKKSITIAGDDHLPYSATDLLNKIRDAKDDLIHDVITKNPTMSSEEVALRANVPEKYLMDGMKAASPSDYMIDPAQHSVVNHVKLEYNIGNPSMPDGQIVRGLLDSQYRIKVIQDASESAIAKEIGPDYRNFIATKSSADATITGARAGFLSFSNSEYGTLGQQMERIGRFTTNELQTRLGNYSRILAPSANALREDPIASAELGAFIAARRRTGETYTFLPADLAKKYWRTEDTAVLTKSLVKDKNGNIIDWNTSYTPEGFLPGAALADNSVRIPDAALHTFYDLSPKVATFERAQMGVNDARIVSRNNWYSAQGISRTQQTGTLYTPPIDTARYPYFAYVKARPGVAFSDDSVGVITAGSAKDLEQKIASLSDDYSIYTKDMLKKYHQVEGDYQYQRNFADNRVNSDLARRGILNDVYPDTRADTIIQQYIDFNSRQETRLLRDYVELGNSQLFAELRAMGERFSGAETSKVGFINKYLGTSAENPYESYTKTALAIGPKDEYRLWSDAQEKVEAFASTAFNMAKTAFTSAQKGLIPFEQVDSIMEKFGLGNPYKAATDAMGAYYNVANKLPPSPILSRLVSTANAITSATAIRLDAWQSAINIISSPILTMAEGRSILGKIGPLGTELPDGSGRIIPSTTKAMYQAVKNFWDPTVRSEWMPLYTRMGIIRENTAEYFNMMNDLALPYGRAYNEGALTTGITNAVNTASKFTGSQWTENFVRYMAADVARQIYSAAGATGTDLIDNIGTFVNRVHGNYIAAQRPVAFQGPIGAALGLFQTYQVNMFQQLFRYVENGEWKTLGMMAGLQAGLFGIQSLPGFQMINQHLVGDAAGNVGHKDLYSTTTNFFDKKLGDYLLYGVASNWLNTGLYSRGDINPRQISIIPINPMDFPAISGGINFIGNLMKTVDKVVQGGDLSTSFLAGLEHNGISRPLSGLAQLMQGFTSTAKGDLVSATRPNMGDNTSGLSDLISAANFSRLLGARPLDEAINMDMLYRSTQYQAKDTTRMERLGEAIKPMLAGNTPMDLTKMDKFTREYVEAGGQIQRFGAEIMRWTQEANVAKANEIFRNLQKPINQQMMMQMGGMPTPDFYNKGNLTQLPPMQQQPDVRSQLPSTALAPVQ